MNSEIVLDERSAPFKTAAEPVLGPRDARTRGQPPQDEVISLMPSRTSLMLRSAQQACLEARTTRVQHPVNRVEPEGTDGRTPH
jgi:hypothetical protein